MHWLEPGASLVYISASWGCFIVQFARQKAAELEVFHSPGTQHFSLILFVVGSHESFLFPLHTQVARVVGKERSLPRSGFVWTRGRRLLWESLPVCAAC